MPADILSLLSGAIGKAGAAIALVRVSEPEVAGTFSEECAVSHVAVTDADTLRASPPDAATGNRVACAVAGAAFGLFGVVQEQR